MKRVEMGCEGGGKRGDKVEEGEGEMEGEVERG